MKKEPTYTEAFEKLEILVEQLADGHIQIDKLTEKVKQAHALISVCEAKLRTIDTEMEEMIKPVKPAKKKSDKK